MKRFMQMLLASFGVMALMLAGCSTTDDTVVEDDVDDTVVDETVDPVVDTTVEEDATVEVAE